jgi:hypothetical protein
MSVFVEYYSRIILQKGLFTIAVFIFLSHELEGQQLASYNASDFWDKELVLKEIKSKIKNVEVLYREDNDNFFSLYMERQYKNGILSEEHEYEGDRITNSVFYNHRHLDADSAILRVLPLEKDSTITLFYFSKETRFSKIAMIVNNSGRWDTVRVLDYGIEEDSSVVIYSNFTENGREPGERTVVYEDEADKSEHMEITLSYGYYGRKEVAIYRNGLLVETYYISLSDITEEKNNHIVYEYDSLKITCEKLLDSKGDILTLRNYWYSGNKLDSITYCHFKSKQLISKEIIHYSGERVIGKEVSGNEINYTVDFKYNQDGIITDEIINIFSPPRRMHFKYVVNR